MIPSAIDNPELASVDITLTAQGISFPNTLGYEMNSHYLTACSSFGWDLDEDELSTTEKAALVPGTGVHVAINDLPQMCGYLDSIDVKSGRGGTVWHMECREWNSPLIDAHADPMVQFSETQTLTQLLTEALSPFIAFSGFGNTDANIQIVTDAAANRNIITGALRGTKTNKNGTILKKVLAHRVKPYEHEPMWSFLMRVATRFGLWLRPTADGTAIICSQPDFTQDPSYGLVHSVASGAQNNVVDGGFKISRMNQPSSILASGFGGGGVFANSTLRAGIVNPVVQGNGAASFSQYPGLTIIPSPTLGPAPAQITNGMLNPDLRPRYMYDSESHNADELASFLRRELSMLMRDSLHADYTIEGHRLGGQPVAVDTVIQVDDDRSNFSGPLWIEGITFTKRPGEGTKTRMNCIRLGTLTFA